MLIADCQEERFSRVKHDWRFPAESIRYCLREAGIPIEAVNTVCFYEKPFLKFERILETFLAVAPRGLRTFVDTVPSWIKQKLRVRQVLSEVVGYSGKRLYAEHHLAHAASAFFTSPFEEAAVLTIDGAGEWATASYGTGRANAVSLSHEMWFPDSLGLLYSPLTAFLGFTVNNAEYKVMGMAPYGRPEFSGLMTSRLLTINPDGSLRLNLDHFSFQYGRTMVGGALRENAPVTLADYPVTTSVSDAISRDLKRRGFRFVGSTVIYAHMQATGMVNDHARDCFRRCQLSAANA